jgi:uncharacterized phage protein (TIGR01671 family)
MRKIEFRGKVINSEKEEYNGMWVYGSLVEVMGMPYKYYIEQLSDWNLNIRWEVDGNTVGQWTGFWDKNEVKIFEEDYVSVNEPDLEDKTNYQVRWYGESDYPAFDLDNWDSESNGLAEIASSGEWKMEVIGNPYDNKTIGEWAKELGIKILDPDGFCRTDPNLMTKLITKKEFERGILECTIKETK